MEFVAEVQRYINLSASGQVKSAPGVLAGIFVASASSTPTIKVWDALTATGLIIANTFTPTGATFYRLPVRLTVGCYITIGGTVDCTVFYD